MSFINIKDPKKRDEIVAEYLATVKRLQNRDITERAHDLTRTEEINRVLEPVVRSTAKSTEAITKELIPIREEIHNLNDRIIAQQPPKLEGKDEDQQQHQPPPPPSPPPNREDEEKEEPNLVQMFYQQLPEEKIDKYFGIIPDGGWNHYKMGKKRVQIEGPDILVDGRRYNGTKGLWSLIMRKVPHEFTREDMFVYRNLVLHTNAMAYPNNLRHDSQVRRTKKWRQIFPLFDTLDMEEEQISPSSPPPSTSNPPQGKTTGDGIQYLPGDIKGLQTKLNYLLAEYRAGNRLSTRNQIVSILDELLRRRKISRKEYKDINTFLH